MCQNPDFQRLPRSILAPFPPLAPIAPLLPPPLRGTYLSHGLKVMEVLFPVTATKYQWDAVRICELVLLRSELSSEVHWKIIGGTVFRYVQIRKKSSEIRRKGRRWSEMVGGPERTSVGQDQTARRVDELHLYDPYRTPTYKVVPSAVCYCLLSHLTAV